MKRDQNDDLAIEPSQRPGIIRRFVLFEPVPQIARAYGLPERVLYQLRDEAEPEIAALRRTWKEWVGALEPLCSKSNQVLFLGMCAREAKKRGRIRDAVMAARDLREVFESGGRADEEDLAMLARLQQGDYDWRNIEAEVEIDELLEIPTDGNGYFVETDERIGRVKKGAKEADAELRQRKTPDPAYKAMQETRRKAG